MDKIKFKKIIEENQSFAITGHTNPDGDCICAALAIACILKQKNKDVCVYMENFSEKYNFLPLIDNFSKDTQKNEKVDVFISVDCASRDRIKQFQDIIKEAKHFVSIDHHVSNTRFADINIVEIISSTCELLYHLFRYDAIWTKELCTLIYAGIVYDTGGFLHSNTSAHTMHVAAYLMDSGISSNYIYKMMMHAKSLKEINLLGIALRRAKFLMENVLFSFITLQDLSEVNGSVKDLDGIVNMLNNCKNAELTIFIYEIDEHQTKISFRSKTSFPCEIFAGQFGGGGHKHAAAASVTMNLKQTAQALKDALLKVDFLERNSNFK